MANNNDWHTPGASLILPFGSTPPYVVLSGDASQLPADLIAFYAGFGETVVAGIVFQSAGVPYDYQVFVTTGGGLVSVAFGAKSSAGTIVESTRYSASVGTAFWDYGLHGDSRIRINNAGEIELLGTSTLTVHDSSILSLLDAFMIVGSNAPVLTTIINLVRAQLTVQTGTTVDIATLVWRWNSGSIATWQNGSSEQFQAGSTLSIDSAASATYNTMPLLAGLRGTVAVVFVAASFQTATVNFSQNFPTAPFVTCQVVSSSGSAIKATVLVTAVSTTQFSIRVDLTAAVSITVNVHWHALV